MKVDLTEEQYYLIREALETFYYYCKDDSGLYHKLKQLNKLEESLIKQSKN